MFGIKKMIGMTDHANDVREKRRAFMAKKSKKMPEFQPGRGYTKEDWDAVDSPELTDEELAKARPFREALPDLAASIDRELARRNGAKPASPNKS
ncbi:hypothetical protein [Rhizobium bangladeshense]|uniref:hypothetical protein n=1 Tax=Rhizobium bangladeshense TaxID=1138189 RepID=UPI001FD9756D|nr:hypothetical protein [Rhizobium bangladeshense]